MNEEFRFKLSSPLSVSVNGEFEDTHELIFTAPSMKERKAVAKLQQIIARAQMSFLSKLPKDQLDALKGGDKPDDSTDDNLEDNGDATRAMIVGSDEDLEALYICFDKLALRVCTVVDGVDLKSSHLAEISLKDHEKMCFGYIANFIE